MCAFRISGPAEVAVHPVRVRVRPRPRPGEAPAGVLDHRPVPPGDAADGVHGPGLPRVRAPDVPRLPGAEGVDEPEALPGRGLPGAPGSERAVRGAPRPAPAGGPPP